MRNNTNNKMCKECGGICCKEVGCIYLPTDFESMNINYLINLINKGNISISGELYNIGNKAFSYLPFLRARNKDADIVDLITLGGPCKLLTANGCKLDISERPALGQRIIPTKIGGPCKKDYELEEPYKWLKYSETLEKLVKYNTKNEMQDQRRQELKIKLKTIKEKLLQDKNLTDMEKLILSNYDNIIKDKTYYSPEKVKKMRLF